MAREKETQLPVKREERLAAPFEWPFESPFSMMRRIREDIDRMFETFGFGSLLAPWERPLLSRKEVWAPACDIWETDEDVKVKCDLPGVDPQDIEISATEDTLRIRAQVREEAEEERRGYYRAERRYGAFDRQFTLPVPVKSDEAKAVFKHGTVEITLPKSEEAKQKMKKIPIETAEPEPAGAKGGKK